MHLKKILLVASGILAHAAMGSPVPGTPPSDVDLPLIDVLKNSKALQSTVLPKIGKNIDLDEVDTLGDLAGQLSKAELARLATVFSADDIARFADQGFEATDLAKLASLPPAVPPRSLPAGSEPTDLLCPPFDGGLGYLEQLVAGFLGYCGHHGPPPEEDYHDGLGCNIEDDDDYSYCGGHGEYVDSEMKNWKALNVPIPKDHVPRPLKKKGSKKAARSCVDGSCDPDASGAEFASWALSAPSLDNDYDDVPAPPRLPFLGAPPPPKKAWEPVIPDFGKYPTKEVPPEPEPQPKNVADILKALGLTEKGGKKIKLTVVDMRNDADEPTVYKSEHK